VKQRAALLPHRSPDPDTVVTVPRSRILAVLLAAAALAGCARTPALHSADVGVADTLPPPLSIEARGTVEIPPLFPRFQAPYPDERQVREPGLEFRLRERPAPAAPAGPAVPRPRPAATPLADAQAAALFARLPALPADTGTDGFRFPPRTPPPPLTGATVLAAFPPPDTVAPPPPERPAEAAPLDILRIVPEGETEMAPHLTVAFSQPMVPLATLADLDARQVPVRLTPQPPGRWRWIDTRTLRFEPEGRFPMATVYVVEVAAGTRSAAGGVLEAAVRHEFAMPGPRAVGGYPHQHAPSLVGGSFGGRGSGGSQFGLQPVIVLVFDQEVDAARVLRSTRLRAPGADHPLRLATAAEIAADSAARQLTTDAPERRWVALRSVRPLPRDAEVRLSVHPGALSGEGPRPTEVRQDLVFRTYAPLRVEEHACGVERGERCPPEAPWVVRFSTPLDTAAWRAEYVRVEPAVEGLRTSVVGNSLVLSGSFRERTTYRVTLDPRIRDVWGQTLGETRPLVFEVGEPGPMVSLPGSPMIVLDPAGPPRLYLHSRGHAELRVRLLRVRPEQWDAFSEAVSRYRQDPRTRAFSPPGEQVLATTIRPASGAGEVAESTIDLAPALMEGLGHLIVVVESTTRPPASDPRRGWHDPAATHGPAFAWVQSTRIGLSAAVDGTDLLAWATSIENGTPLGGAEVRLLPSGARATTAADGTARLPLPALGDGVLVARRGNDAALLPDQEPGWRGREGGSWRRQPPRDRLAWWVASDRGLYRPGERVHLKGWIRRIEAGPRGDVGLPRRVTGVGYTLQGPRGEELGTGNTTWGGLGGFHLAFDLPAELNLGEANVQLRARGATPEEGGETWHGVRVQEFRRPEFEVRMEMDPGPHVVGGSVDATATAAYYGGGGLPDTEVEWRVRSGSAHFTPPGWDGWHFGRRPWWFGFGGGEDPGVRNLVGRTGADGMHRVTVDALRADPPFAHLLRTTVEVRDVNRQVGSATGEALVHPAEVYVGLRAERGWVRPGDTLNVQVATVGIGGAPAAGRPVHVRAERVEWRPGRWGGPADSVVVQAECRIVSGAEPARCLLPVREPGTLRVVAEVRDAQGRVSRTEWLAWSAGGPPPPPSPDRPQTGEVALAADRERYLPGETVELLVQPPFYPAEGILTLRRSGLLRTERFRVTGPSHTLRIPVTDEQTPGFHAHVRVVDARRGVREAVGEVLVQVSPRRRELQVAITPRDTLARPGAETAVDVVVRDAAGRPVPGAEVALWMVDESVLALGGYSLPDPLELFHPQRGPGMRDHELRTRVVLARLEAAEDTLATGMLDASDGRPIQLFGREYVMFGVPRTFAAGQLRRVGAVRGAPVFAEPGAPTPPQVVYIPVLPAGEMQPFQLRTAIRARDGGPEMHLEAQEMTVTAARAAPAAPPPPPTAGGRALADQAGGADPVALRAEFAPLAVFEPSLRTGPDGRVRVPVRLPESLTRYRVVAVAVEGATRYGRGEANVTARRELMVRPAAPRFLNFGDRAEVPVVVQNTTPNPLVVDVALRASGLRTEGPAAQRVTVPAGDRAELRFAVRAERAGRAHLQVIGTSGPLSDAAGVEIPVYTPATTEAFAVYGEIDTGAPVVLPVGLPRDVIAGFGGLEVTVSSTALQALTDAVVYLYGYPFEGAEPLASRILGIAALRDVLGAFAAEGLPPPAEIDAAVGFSIGRLAGLQGPTGGWNLWRMHDEPHAFVSIHAAHAFARAREKGYRVPDENVQRALEFLRGIDRWVPREHGPRERNSLVAYALYTRDRLGDRGAVQAARQLAAGARPEELSVEAMAWLLHLLARTPEARAESAELLRRIRNRATETAATATFATAYSEGEYLLLHSGRRSDAVVLEALIAADPRSDLIAKTARGLLAHRTRGRWQGPQENAWVLLALERYFRTYEATTPDFRSGVWLGGQYAGGHAFRGRTTERHHLEIPMREVMRLTGPAAMAPGAGTPRPAAGAPAPRPADGAADLLLQRQGAGRMYYRAGLRYAPADLTPEPTQRGFVVERSYEALDDPADVRRDADGTWRVRAGARVRVRLNMIAPERRHHVALVDALPAGFEAVNPELQGVGFTDEPPAQPMPMPRPMPRGAVRGGFDRPAPGGGMWWGRWWIHQNLRDDRAEAFASLLPAGSYEYTYIARATTPGTFVVPPPRAEEMYSPETFGRGAGGRVVVE
jgi:alpha-2-macroglobulin